MFIRHSLWIGVAVGCALAGRAGAGEVGRIVIDTDRSVNCATLETITTDVCRGCKTDRDKAIALFNFVIRTIYMPYSANHPAELTGRGVGTVRDPLKLINVYGGAGCGRQACVYCSLLDAVGIKSRLLGPGFAHTSDEVFWDGKWHWMDVWLPCYFMDEKGGIYSYHELMADRDRLVKAKEAGRVSENFMYYPKEDFETVLKAKNFGGRGSGVIKPKYREDLRLRPGERCTWLWDHVGKWYWPGEKFAFPAFKFSRDKHCKQAFPYWEPYKKVMAKGPRRRTTAYYRYYGNAVFVTAPPLTEAGLKALDAKITGATFVDGGVQADKGAIDIAFEVPYVLADSEVAGAADVPEGASVQVAYSLDGGKTFKTASTVAKSGKFGPVSLASPNNPKPPRDVTSGHYRYVLRIGLAGGATLKALTVTNTTMLNFYSRPWLEPGDNNVTVTADGGEALTGAPLEITWNWVEGWKSDGPKARTFTHKVARSGAKAVIKVGGKGRPKMKSITIARAAK